MGWVWQSACPAKPCIPAILDVEFYHRFHTSPRTMEGWSFFFFDSGRPPPPYKSAARAVFCFAGGRQIEVYCAACRPISSFVLVRNPRCRCGPVLPECGAGLSAVFRPPGHRSPRPDIQLQESLPIPAALSAQLLAVLGMAGFWAALIAHVKSSAPLLLLFFSFI